jgi:two-component system, OmpR family, alkaline phosphatase synthesis response regulator PhoP
MVGSELVLVVDDEPTVRDVVRRYLEREGYQVALAADGPEALASVAARPPDLVVLDIMLPELNGYELLKELRRRGRDTPVVMLSAKGMEVDKILGLNLGADDYVAKPFGLQELLARIKAVLRRRYPSAGTPPVTFGDVEVDLVARTVARAGKPVELTAQEFKLLAHFLAHPGRTFTREELLSGAWGFDYEGSARTVDNFMRQLRTKFEPDPEDPRHFVTVRGLGYRFDR